MRRMTFAVAVLVASCAGTARADTLPMISGVPLTYTPGQAFTFTVTVPFVPELISYNLQLDFSTPISSNPTLTAFATVANPAPAGNYVFPSNANFNSMFNPQNSSTDANIMLSDFVPTAIPFAGQTSANNGIAQITVTPTADVGPITISVDPSTTFDYDNLEGPRYLEPGTYVVQPNDTGPSNPVPTPPGAILLGIGGVILGVRSRFRGPVA